jgi:hypothetical protein
MVSCEEEAVAQDEEDDIQQLCPDCTPGWYSMWPSGLLFQVYFPQPYTQELLLKTAPNMALSTLCTSATTAVLLLCFSALAQLAFAKRATTTIN